VRFPIVIAIASVVTFGLFWAMQALVGVSGKLEEGRPPPSVEFVRLKRDTTPEEKKREPPKREKPEAPPPQPDISMSKASLDPGEGVGAIAPSIDPNDALSGGMGIGGGSDRDAVPLVRIQPEYPMNARQRGIEGWVTLEFTITNVGTVRDPRVLASQPGNVFDRSAMRAITKWKYNPKIQDGQAVERKGTVTLEFTMED
jgi:protein TonB